MYKYSAAIKITGLWKYLKLKIFFVYGYWFCVLGLYLDKYQINRPCQSIHALREEFKEAYGVLCNSKKALMYDGYCHNLRWHINKPGLTTTTVLYQVASTLWLCEKAGINAEFCASKDGVQTVFDIPESSSLSEEIVPICCIRAMGKYTVPSKIAYKLSEKLPVRKELGKQADEWFDKNIRGDWVAVHYRGTDIKVDKATIYEYKYKIELEPYITYLRTVLDDKYSIFVCSDQAQFIDKMQVAFPGRVFVRDIQRSSNKKALHLSPEYKGIQQRKDALIDMLILAKANLIYTTGSTFVDAVRYFNPKTKIVSLDGRKIKGCQIPIPQKDVFDKLKIKTHRHSVTIKIVLLWKHLKLKLFFVYSYWSYVLHFYLDKVRKKVKPFRSIHDFSEEFKKAYSILCKGKKAIMYDGYSYNLRWQINRHGNAIDPILSKIVSTIWMCEKAGINAEFCTNRDEFQTLFDIPGQSSSDKILPLFHPRPVVKHISPSQIVYKLLSEKLPVSKELRKEADEWFNKHIKGDWVAVHYRGTDIEAGKTTKHKNRYKIELESYITYLRVVLDDECSIFACSDQAQFIDKMQVAFPGRVFARNIQRSSSRKSLHRHLEYKGIQQQQDALIDILILAKADLIYTTGSAFVNTVRYFNPETKIVSLGWRGKRCYIPIPRKDVFDSLKRK